MPPRRNRIQEVEGKLSNSLVLNRYILSLFGATSLEALSEHLKDPVLEGWDENNVSYAYSGGYPFSISGDIRSVPS